MRYEIGRVRDSCLLRKGVQRMRRVILVLAIVAATLVAASGMAMAVNRIGINGPDTLKGTDGADNLLGRGGNDVLFGFGGRDNLLGEDGKDWVLGGNERRPLGGDKNLVGGSGNDAVLGGRGPDKQFGGSGNDIVNGDSGSDKISGEGGTDYLLDGEIQGGATDTVIGGEGNDVLDIINRPAKKDIVACGSGFDRVLADTEDLVAPDCENVAVGPAAAQRLNEQLEEEGFFDRIFGGLAPPPFE
jgi:Ca2+-binding RTX toxin-like protein